MLLRWVFLKEVAQLLTERFGGVTSFSRSPGEGRWKNRGATEHDDIVVIEVMAEELDRAWWSQLRKAHARVQARRYRHPEPTNRANAVSLALACIIYFKLRERKAAHEAGRSRRAA